MIIAGYRPIGKWAKTKFEEYGKQGFKVFKTDSKGIMFTNTECDDSSKETYLKTFKFGFWVERDELDKVEAEDAG